ncbi:MAG: FRG domain-containing protein [Nitrospirota bacterium]|nr:FRG domain-containing protein [Nitrospirota bacterium]
MIEPYDYYNEYDSVAEKLSEIKSNVDTVTNFAQQKGYRIFWRGQANHEWGLTSSLARTLSTAAGVDDHLLNRVEQALLDEASEWITDLHNQNYTHPLAKLAYLQHHGIPTRLIDFTSNPWMAVFFAAESLDKVDGRLFAIMVNETDCIDETPPDTPWHEYPTNAIKIYNPEAAGIVFPRLTAQGGVLALGRLPSTTPHRKANDKILNKSRALLAEEVRKILSVPFKLSRFDPGNAESPIPNRVKLPIGLTFRLHVNKESIRRDLAGLTRRNIFPRDAVATHKTVYPDATGMVAHSKILLGLKQGVLVL